MSNAASNPEPVRDADRTQRIRPEAALIAPGPLRRHRAAAFQAYVLGAALVFVVLAVVAHAVDYFPIDVTITRGVQGFQGPRFDRLMQAVSWLGYYPQVALLSAAGILVLFVSGLRWEAVSALFAATSVGVGALVKLVVLRPRPSADLVRVFQELPSSGFPSGHVLSATAYCGFLAFLCFTLLKSSPGRTMTLVACCLFLVLMGLSRIQLGQHWFSDVMGAYLFGSLWLALTIRLYRWGKTRGFVRRPVAPAGPATSGLGSA